MSTIVVTRKGGWASIATDSQYSIGSMLVPPDLKINSHKIYQVREAFIALTGWAAIDDIVESLIREHLDMLDFSNRAAIFNTFLNIQGLLVSDYFVNPDEESDQPVASSQIEGAAISPEGIFMFSSYRNVNAYNRYWASGSGREYALGAMHCAFDRVDSSKELAQIGIESACAFDSASSLPFQLKSVKLSS